MSTSREKDFGLLISFVLPGFILLLGLAHHSETLMTWLGKSGEASPSVGGFLFLTVASVFAGMTVSTIRWAIVDAIHQRSGIKQPSWDFSRLAGREDSFEFLIAIHYRFYQFYSNSMIAIVVALVARWTSEGFLWIESACGLAVCILFFAGSRDTLRKYYHRVDRLLAAR